jgi:nucleoside-diphosphate-sugar epimerase
MKTALVTGAGGFIGHHLVKYLKARGYWVRGVDIKKPEFEDTAADEFWQRDLRFITEVWPAFGEKGYRPDEDELIPVSELIPFDEVYALAADMGGMGYIGGHGADILNHNLLINLNTLEIARRANAGRYLFTSSACVYPEGLQQDTAATALAEDDAYPADPDTDYGWEKLTTERLCLAYARDYGMDVRIARFHNVYGPLGTWRGGREKAPAALCRKVAEKVGANEYIPGAGSIEIATGEMRRVVGIDIWGDGKQTRSFLYIDDCLEALYALMQSDYRQPLNIGSNRMVSINHLADIVGASAGVAVAKNYVDGPQGVRGRNSDNTRCEQVLGWRPQVSLEVGIYRTYAWIAERVREAARA